MKAARGEAVTGWELHASLPPTVSLEEILATNDVSSTVSTLRVYCWNGWEFELPPGVFRPGATSRLLHDRLLDGTLQIAGKRFASMGVGVGIEAVVAGLQGAEQVFGLDIHPSSVRTAERYYGQIVGGSGPPFVGLVSDLWRALPAGVRFDVIAFNPPFIDVSLSDNPDVIRNLCRGFKLARRFFDEIQARSLLLPGGVVYMTVSNTAPLRDVVALALERGLHAEALLEEDWPGDSIKTYLFAFRRV
jgi:release factor glutamine methyltransferase